MPPPTATLAGRAPRLIVDPADEDRPAPPTAGPAAPSRRAHRSGRLRTRAAPSSLAPLLVLTPLAIGAGLECHLQLVAPDASALAWLHARGVLTEVPIGYEPGRGVGRALGIAGAAMMTLMLLYSVRKRVPILRSLGRLSRWLDVHIAFGLVGPALVTLHTAGRLGGIIAVAYWSMLIVVASGVVGRYLYAQVPRTITGRERTLGEISDELGALVTPELAVARERGPRALGRQLVRDGVPRAERCAILSRSRHALRLERQIRRLEATRRLLSLWHRLHLPLVGVLYGIMALHIGVAILFDSR